MVSSSYEYLYVAMTGSKITNKIEIIQNTYISTYSNAIIKKNTVITIVPLVTVEQHVSIFSFC